MNNRIRYYYNLDEIYNGLLDIIGNRLIFHPIINYGESQIGVYDFVESLLNHQCEIDITQPTYSLPNDNEYSKELMKHIWNNMWNKEVIYHDIVYGPGEQVPALKPGLIKHTLGIPPVDRWYNWTKEVIFDFATSFLSIYEDTKARYEALLAYYTALQGDLLDQISSTTEVSASGDTRFNDTPQNLPTDDGYAADNYTTNITKSTSGSTTTTTTDMNTPAARLAEIDKTIRNLYGDWAAEFNKLIITSED